MTYRNRRSAAAYDDPHRYDDMLRLPHPTSAVHPRMSRESRAAQFSPFAALTGFGTQISSAHKMRCSRTELTEEELRPIQEALASLKKHDRVCVLHFVEDFGTDGSGGFAEGEYLETKGEVLELDPVKQCMRVEQDGSRAVIYYEDILSVTIKNSASDPE